MEILEDRRMGRRDAVIIVAHGVDQQPGKTAILSLNIPYIAAPLFGAFDLQAEQCVPAADYGARPVDQHIPGVGAGIVIQLPQIEQAGVTLQFCPLKTAGNAGQIVFGVSCTMKNGVPVQM